MVRGRGRLRDQAAGMAQEEPASLQPALRQAEGPVQRARHGHQLRPGPGVTGHKQDAQGIQERLMTLRLNLGTSLISSSYCTNRPKYPTINKLHKQGETQLALSHWVFPFHNL